MDDSKGPAPNAAGPPRVVQRVYQYQSTDGSQPFSYLSYDEWAALGCLAAEAMLGTMDGETFSLERWRRNPLFLQFMHKVIQQEGPNDPALQAVARGRATGWAYVIDLRTPDGPQGRVPTEDIIGAFEVRDGRIVRESYKPMPGYRVLTVNGFPQLPAPLHAALIAALKQRCREGHGPPPETKQDLKPSWWKFW